MNIITSLFSKAIDKQVASQMNSINAMLGVQFDALQSSLAERFQMLGGTALYRSSSTQNNIKEGYAGNADVYAIIRLIAKTAAMVPLYVYEVKDEKAYKQFKQLQTKSYDMAFMEQYHDLHRKSLEMMGEEDELQKLIDNPNGLDEKQEFYTGVYGYHLLDGNSFIYYPTIPDGANKGKIQGLYMMPPQYTTIISTNTFPRMILGYRIDVNGVNLVESDEVMHMKYWNPEFSYDGHELIGLSPLRAMAKALYRSTASADNSVSQLQHGGPAAVIYNKSIAADNLGIEATAKLQSMFSKKFEGVSNAGKVMLSPGELGLIRTGLTPVELNAIVGENFTRGQLANGYGISDTLLNNHETSTESNVKEMRKGLYTNAALPEVYSLRDSFNKNLAPHYQKSGRRKVINEDVSGISELQPDYKTMADTFAAMPVMRPNDVFEAFKYGKMQDPNMDKIFIKQGYQLLEDVAMTVEPLDIDPNNPESV